MDIRLYAVKELEIPQEYIDLKDVADKEAAHTLPNPILVEHKIDTRDKKPSFRLLYNLLENELAVFITDSLSTILRLLGEESAEASWLIQARSRIDPVEPYNEK